MTLAVSGVSAALYRDELEEYVVTALGSNRDICFASKNGTDASVEILVAGNNTPLSVTVLGTKVTIASATGSGGAATSTAAQIVAAFNLVVAAAALFTARLIPGSTGVGITGALSETHAAAGVAFTGASLVDSGDHLTYQVAKGSRYWDPEKALTIYSDAAPVTSGFIVNYLRGSVTFDASMTGHTITATGTRRSESAFRRVMLVYDGKMKINGKEIDTSNLDDDGWGSAVMGAKSWEMPCSAYFYPGNLPIDEIGTSLIVKFYSIYTTSKSFVGRGQILNMEDLVASSNAAQNQTITIKGAGEIYRE